MEPDQPAPERSGEGHTEAEVGGPSPPGLSLEQLREMTGALAAELSHPSLLSQPASPEAVRELAADLAARLLHQMMQSAGAGGADADVHGMSLGTGGPSCGQADSCEHFGCTAPAYGCLALFHGPPTRIGPR